MDRLRDALPFAAAFVVALTAAAGAAAPPVWMHEPIAMDDEVDASLIERVASQLQPALARRLEEQLMYGAAAVLLREQQGRTAAPRAASARALLAEGEELYMAFEFARAAATLAEAASLYTVALAELDRAEVEQLYRARLLEGLAWLEGGQPDAARAAFVKLVTIRPDFAPDPRLVPPHGREVFEQALAQARGAGVCDLQIRTEPAGAEVILDGVSRGRAPLSLSAVPAGAHGLRLVLPGHQLHTEEVRVGVGRAERHVVLQPTPAQSALERLRAGARGGASRTLLAHDVDLVTRAAGSQAAILVGVARRQGRVIVTGVRLAAQGGAAVVAATSGQGASFDVERFAELLLADTWPVAQLPVGDVTAIVDFERGVLGLGPGWGGEEVRPPQRGLAPWWVWGGAAVVGIAGATAAVLLLAREPAPPAVDRTTFSVGF